MSSACCTPQAPKKAARSRIREDGVTMKRRKVCLNSPSPKASSSSVPVNLCYLTKNFRIVRKLGEGDFGEVKEVQCKRSSNKFAVKIFKVKDELQVKKSGLNFTKDNLHEIRTHKSIRDHIHIVKFFGAWREGSYLYLLMEICANSLEGYWKKVNCITQTELQTVLNQMLQALNHLASSNIAHLDIKPANILRTCGGIYKLADFSVTVNLSEASTPEMFGTGFYAAPEIYLDQFTPKADIYSLAISIVQVSVDAGELLTVEDWAMVKHNEQLPIRAAKGLDESLQSTLRRMLTRDHSSRPSAADLLAGCTIEEAISDIELNLMETKILRESTMRARLSLPASAERKMRANKSPLIRKSEGVLFDTDDTFFEMPQKQTSMRASLGNQRRVIAFNLDSDDK